MSGFRSTRVIRRMLHYGPLLASFIIMLVTIMTCVCVCVSTPISNYRRPDGQITWRHHATAGAFINLTIFLILAILTTYHFLCSIFHGPGFVRSEWRPENKKEEPRLQWCAECEAFKSPRSHHCKKCARCVKKMDHHCPWINCCVGHKNHAHFIRFLFYASTGCFYGGTNIASAIIRMVFFSNSGTNFILLYYFSGVTKFIVLVFSCGVAYGVSIAVGFLLVMQVRDITRNQTSIESWIITKAEWRHKMKGTEFVYPYDLGSRWENFTAVVNMSNFAKGDGYTWPVQKGCDQYTLTHEQILQKQLKRSRMVEHKITVPYNTAWCSYLTLANPLLFCVCNGIDDQYLRVSAGETVMVSRYRKRWLYGCVTRKTLNKAGEETDKEFGGWFPRLCAMEVAQKKKKGVENPPEGDGVGVEHSSVKNNTGGESKKTL